MATPQDAKRLTILLTGGGTGGHITPLLAVAEELRRLSPDCTIISVGDRGSTFSHLTDSHDAINGTRSIFAGKFRRYHGESMLRQFLDAKTLALNVRDFFYVIIGLLQSFILIRRIRPDVVFLKGGFVGVPIGLAAAFWRVPIVTHDSDALPGLANRIVGRWATFHATALPKEFYTYDDTKVRHVGVLVGQQYSLVSEEERRRLRVDVELGEQGRLLFVTGGSLGSQRINGAMQKIVPSLLSQYKDLTIIHQVGKGNGGVYGTFTDARLKVLQFLDGMYKYSGAADVIVTRAGANTMAEFGIQAKACIVIPSPFLAGGHQLKNGEYLRAAQAALIVDETTMMTDPNELKRAICALLDNQAAAKQLASNLHSLTLPDASNKLAQLLIEATR